MTCSNCQTDNAPESKFCRECGTPLAAACPTCANPVDPNDKFCAECGTALQSTQRPAPAADPVDQSAEKRFVSVLFADIVAYTTFSEGRDPDEIRDLLTVYFDRARAIIEKFGGVVDKFIGDAVMGVWGSEVVREDDAERAVRAALELVSMVSDLGSEQGHHGLQLRAGVNSGSTSVGPGGNEKGLVVGDLVNTASRLQSAAEAGTVLVGQTTHEVTSSSIVYEDIGAFSVKGKADEVSAWRAVRPAGRVGAAQDIRELPFTGRDREMRLLKDMLEATGAEQRARLVSITGEAGIGKSRLAREFMNHVDGFAETIYWHNGRSPSYGDGLPMWSVGEMVRQRAGIVEDEEPSRARTRLRTALAEHVGSEDDRQWIEGWLAGLLGIADMPPGSGSELHSALRSFFQNISSRGTTVLVFEDLHWADPSVIEFITELVDRSTRSPILVITLARPELLEKHPTFGVQQRSSMSLSLAPLSEDEMRQMLAEHLPGLAGDIVRNIVERASGFPLYVAEFIRMLTNAGMLVEENGTWNYRGDWDDVAVPETLQAVIGARLDRLESDLRSLLQEASVLGLTFTAGGLTSVSGRDNEDVTTALRRLIQLELIDVEEDPRSPERGQYRFVQGVIQEIAYRRLNRTDRRIRHLAAAEYFNRSDDPELAGVVASHFLGAYEASPAGAQRDELAHRALEALVGAARRSAALHSDQQAMDLFDQAIALSTDPSERAAWCLEASRCGIADGDTPRTIEFIDRARALFGEAHDPSGTLQTATALSELYNNTFRSDEALAVIDPVYRELDDVHDAITLRVAAEATRSYSLTGRLSEAIGAADRALPAAARLGDTETIVEVLISRATAVAFAGRHVEAIAGTTGVLAVADDHGLLHAGVRALNNLSAMMWLVNPQRATELAREVLERVKKLGGTEWLVRAVWGQLDVAASEGDWAYAAETLATLQEFDLDESWHQRINVEAALIDTLKGDPTGPDRIEAVLAEIGSVGDPQGASALANVAARGAEVARDWRACHQHSLACLLHPDGVRAGARASVWLGDSKLLEPLDTMVADPRSLVEEHTAQMLGATRLGLEGDLERSAQLFRTLLGSMTGVEVPLEVVGVQAAFAKVCAGRDDATAAGRAAAEWLAETGTLGLAHAWADALPDLSEARSAS